MQNQIFDLSNKLHLEVVEKEQLVNSGKSAVSELECLKKSLEDFKSSKTEQICKLESVEASSSSLKLQLEDALRRFVIRLGIIKTLKLFKPLPCLDNYNSLYYSDFITKKKKSSSWMVTGRAFQLKKRISVNSKQKLELS